MDGTTIKRLQEVGATIFRINLSHTKLQDAEKVIRNIRQHTDLPICIDSEGAQIRTGMFVDGAVHFRENTIVSAYRKLVPGDALSMNFVPRDIIDRFQVGDFISIDFNSVLVQVIDLLDDRAFLRVIAGGTVGSNKAVTVQRSIPMPALSEKDVAAMKIGLEHGIRHFALSFANFEQDVDDIRKIVGDDAFVISKIECKNGIENLDGIMDKSSAILIDRGDLSREMPLERIPDLQKMIISRAKKRGRPVYVATNLLESMIEELLPTRAEINDIHNSLLDGADGLVLAAETAIGNHPIRCANMIVKMIESHEKGFDQTDPLSYDSTSLLVAPHGGTLCVARADPCDIEGLEELPTLSLPVTSLMDCEQLANGVYSPLNGFMDSATVHSVLDEMRLPDGTSWPMPILLPVGLADADSISVNECLRLTSENGETHAVINVTEIFELDLDDTAQKWFGTTSDSHPGVSRLFAAGNKFIAGAVTLTKALPSQFRHYNLSPEKTRFVFNHRGWSRVVGFHGRNPPHQAHTFIQLEALASTGADGLYINPVIGPQKPGDFHAEYVLKSYQMMLEFKVYPQGRVMLGSFSTYPRYCGPREAVFTAICRQNMGCSHFIVGRDHAGVGNFYGPTDSIRLFESMPDIGIQPVFFDAVSYDPASRNFTVGATDDALQPISGTAVRDSLKSGKKLPEWVMWEPLQEMLIAEIAAGNKVFAE